jgi:hypothetical protein
LNFLTLPQLVRLTYLAWLRWRHSPEAGLKKIALEVFFVYRAALSGRQIIIKLAEQAYEILSSLSI